MKNLKRKPYEINPFTADSSFNSDNRNGVRRFGYRHRRNGNANNDFHGFYGAEIHHPHHALHRFQSAEMGSYYCRNRVDFSDTFLINITNQKTDRHMKTTSNITDFILVKSDTGSDWDNCHFALIHCTKDWRERMEQRLNSLQSVESEYGFVSLNYYDTSVDFYRADEKTQTEIDQLLGEKDWAFVELDENEQDTFLVPENRLNYYRLSLYQYGTGIYTAHGKHSGEEFYTTEFPIKTILEYHQKSIKIVQLF